MNKKHFSLNVIVFILVLNLLGLQLNAAPQGNAESKVPVIIFTSAYKHIPGLEADAKDIIQNVRKEFELERTNDNYHRAMIDVIDENSDNQGDFLIVYLLPKGNWNSDIAKVTVDRDYQFISVSYDYQLHEGDQSSDFLEPVRACNCPDDTVEILLSTCETGIPTAVAGVNNIANTATNAGYTVEVLMGSEENSTNIDNWLCCPNLKMWGRIGHGLTNSIQLADGNLYYTYFNNLPAGQIQGKIFYWNSCQVFNSPMKDAVLNAGAGKFIGGICNLYIGSSEEVFKCWSTQNMNQVAPPSGITDAMCYWSSSCESSTGYPQLGCHGCGGPTNVFPSPGGQVTYTLSTSVSGQGSVTLDPSGGTYTAGTVVTLTATPNAGWMFDHWSGDLSGTANPTTVTMDADKSVTANFIQSTNPPVANFTASSTSVTVNQTVYFTDTSTNGPTSWSWNFGDGATSSQQNPSHSYISAGTYTVSLTASNSYGSDTETKTGYITVVDAPLTVGITNVFSSTSVSGNRRAMPFTMPENGTLHSISMYHAGGSGNFILAVYNGTGSAPQNRIATTASTAINGSAGWQTVNLTNSVYVASGSTIWLAWVFENNPGIAYQTGSPGRADSGEGWSGGMPTTFGSSTQTSYQYSIYANYSAGGTLPQYTLTANTSGQGNISMNPAGGVYDEGTVVTLTATAASGWQFSGWSGDLTGSANPATVTMNSNKTVTATFTAISSTDDIGITTVYGSTSVSGNRRAMPFTMTENGTIQSISMYHTGGNGNMILAVYNGTSSPQNRIAITATTAVSGSTGWQTINLTTPVYVQSGTTIWLAWVFENNPGIRYTTGSPGRFDSGTGWTGGMPTTFGSGSQTSYLYSIYATYSK